MLIRRELFYIVLNEEILNHYSFPLSSARIAFLSFKYRTVSQCLRYTLEAFRQMSQIPRLLSLYVIWINLRIIVKGINAMMNQKEYIPLLEESSLYVNAID